MQQFRRIKFANILCKPFPQSQMRESPLPPSSSSPPPPLLPFPKFRNVNHLIVFVAYSLGRQSMRVVRKILSLSPKRTRNLPSPFKLTLSTLFLSPPLHHIRSCLEHIIFLSPPCAFLLYNYHPPSPAPPISQSIMLLYYPPRILLLLHYLIIHSFIIFNPSPSPPHHHHQYPAAAQYYKH